jgi:hypothetical protein
VIEQLTLAPVHRGDPAESRAAARKVRADSQRVLVLRVLYDASEPLTDDRIGELCGIPARPDAGTRRGVLVREGLVERAGSGTSARGNPCAAWCLTAAGRRYVEGER